MSFHELLSLLEADKEQWRIQLGKEKINFFFLFLFLREYRIVYRFRLCSFLRTHKLLFIFYCIERFLYRRTTLKNGCDIPSHVVIGPGWVIHHCNGIVVNPITVIGKNFVIRSGSVIGRAPSGVPVIGDNVELGVHSVNIGNCHIADNCVIGAGAVVTKSTEPDGIYAGVPAKRIKDR